jgi:general stress protein YciG
LNPNFQLPGFQAWFFHFQTIDLAKVPDRNQASDGVVFELPACRMHEKLDGAKRGGKTMTEKKKRGFSVMDEATKREIARKGGIAAHRKGTAHRFTSEEAREAGRKGGRSANRSGRAHRFTT